MILIYKAIESEERRNGITKIRQNLRRNSLEKLDNLCECSATKAYFNEDLVTSQKNAFKLD